MSADGRTRRMRLAPEGTIIIVASGALVLATVALSLEVGQGRLLWAPAIAMLWFLAVVQFFRDPERTAPAGERLIVSPADGKVISVGDAMEKLLSPPGQRISIFMSPVNVHVNRSPFSGVVKRVVHNRGKFLSAFKPEAALKNEHTEVLLETAYGEIAFKQIAGYIARRIIFHPRAGDRLATGERVGMIRFGSRVDVFVPDTVQIRVKVGEMVTAGETILGEFRNAN